MSAENIDTPQEISAAVPREIDEKVIAAAMARGEIIPSIIPAAAVAVRAAIHQGQNDYFHA